MENSKKGLKGLKVGTWIKIAVCVVFVAYVVLILLRKKYKMPVIDIQGKKDNNSSGFKICFREY